MIPDWTREGLLPPGVHAATWPEVVSRFGWNAHRLSLLLGLRDLLDALKLAGCSGLWLDGSFVTNKEYPQDYDACWDPTGVQPILLDRVLLLRTDADRRASRSRYLGDVFIAGVETGSGLAFVEFFQQSRDGTPKGIVLLDPQENR